MKISKRSVLLAEDIANERTQEHGGKNQGKVVSAVLSPDPHKGSGKGRRFSTRFFKVETNTEDWTRQVVKQKRQDGYSSKYPKVTLIWPSGNRIPVKSNFVYSNSRRSATRWWKNSNRGGGIETISECLKQIRTISHKIWIWADRQKP